MSGAPVRSDFLSALPFWLSLAYLPVVALAGWLGGWWLALTPVFGWWVMSLVDVIGGLRTENADPQTPDENLRWYTLITLIWPFLQAVLVFGALAYVSYSDRLGTRESWIFMATVGIASGTIGINYAHELMHQKSRFERFLGDMLMTMVLYGHFRSEHLLVHHRYVGTPRDPVTARYNEGFHRFFRRVLVSCLRSAFKAEKAMLARKGLPASHRSNPFWKYAAWQLGWLLLAYLIGGWAGVGMFCLQALVAVWQLELVNYVEHYGLTRRHLGKGKYEHVLPRHSWNAAHRLTNYVLINLQRHSDHHYKPSRRFPLLQNYDADEAPQLPYSYPIMTIMAMMPPVWRRYMNPKVRAWRRKYYPDVEDWTPYNKATNPLPR
ncbi:alkane 1-monooxygenase [Neptunicoccus sediminis]|uniref:alkane 1-monooxygenase n=1 Tax=Neptunicoccus sediminis TaxID=1892596 RepID=UPI000845F621|nr:alkane 1-monooxygenase [Neptunicoccus sediminis]